MSNHTSTQRFLTGTLCFGENNPSIGSVLQVVDKHGITNHLLYTKLGLWWIWFEYPNPDYVMSAMELAQFRLENNIPFPDEDADYLKNFQY